MSLRNRLHSTINLVAAFASRMIGQQEADDTAQEEKPQRLPRRALEWRHSHTFGSTPPVIDPGGVHAYARRARGMR